MSTTQKKEQREFLDEKLNPRLDDAEAGRRKLFFVDASHFVHGALSGVFVVCRSPLLENPFGTQAVQRAGSVGLRQQDLVTVTNLTYITAETVCQLLTVLAAKSPGMPITLVLDNARYQRCRLVQDLAVSLGIELLFLPSYSPNLNLIERLWKFVKGECLNGKYYETYPAFQASIEDCLGKIPTKHRDDIDSLITRNFQLFDKETILQV